MKISVSIQPFLDGDQALLTAYLDTLVCINRDSPDLSVHFDYFERDVATLALLQDYATRVPVYVHAKQQKVAPASFQAVSVDVRELKGQPNATGIVFDLGAAITGYENLIKKYRHITIMSVKCGRCGQSFNASALSLVAQVRKINPQAIITMDGGINNENIALVKNAGVDIAVVGNYARKCFEAGNLQESLNRLLRV